MSFLDFHKQLLLCFTRKREESHEKVLFCLDFKETDFSSVREIEETGFGRFDKVKAVYLFIFYLLILFYNFYMLLLFKVN